MLRFGFAVDWISVHQRPSAVKFGLCRWQILSPLPKLRANISSVAGCRRRQVDTPARSSRTSSTKIANIKTSYFTPHKTTKNSKNSLKETNKVTKNTITKRNQQNKKETNNPMLHTKKTTYHSNTPTTKNKPTTKHNRTNPLK